MTETGDTFGSRLREARERGHITLESIASATKIKRSLLAALERNDVSQWPRGIYRRAFLRDYAIAIGLPPQEVLVEFLRLFPDDEHVPAPAVEQPSDELRLTLAVERRSAIRIALIRSLARIRDSRLVVLAGRTVAWFAVLAGRIAAWFAVLAGRIAAWFAVLAGRITAWLRARLPRTVTATYAVSLEFETKAPLTLRGTVRGIRAHTCLARAFRQAVKEFPGEQWSSLVVVLKRVESPSDSAVAEQQGTNATPPTEGILLDELPLPSRARSPQRGSHQPPTLPSVPPQPTARLGGADQSVGR